MLAVGGGWSRGEGGVMSADPREDQRSNLLLAIVLRSQKSLIICFLLFSSVLCSGMQRYFSEAIIPSVTQVDNDILFDIPKAKKPIATELSGIVVSRIVSIDRGTHKPVAAEEVFWHVEMDRRQFKESPLIEWPIRYGQQITNASQHVPPKKIQPGRYRFSGSVRFVDPNVKDEDSRKYLPVEFSIDGDLRLKP